MREQTRRPAVQLYHWTWLRAVQVDDLDTQDMVALPDIQLSPVRQEKYRDRFLAGPLDH